MPKPSDYKHIRAWGEMMGSFEYYIKNQQEQAATDNAPLTAIYKRGDKWSTFDEVESEATRWVVKQKLREAR